MPSGSYPLMNLAAEYGVEYGDLLVWAEHLRHDRVTDRANYPQGRWSLLLKALLRIGATTGPERYSALVSRMVAHANQRWGEAPPVFAPLLAIGARP